MAQYKVLQDIEAEDKLVGPLSLRQFIYAIIVVAILFIGYQLARINFLLAIPFLPPLVFFGLLAAPFGRTQSSEVWLLAKFRYWILPKKRIWDQFGQQELVKINVPKAVEKHLTKDFDKDEAQSRLKALANTLDTRGWAVKNVTTEMFQRSTSFGNQSQDRLINIDSIPRDATESTPTTSDVLDPNANPVAAKLETMIESNESTHREQLMAKMQALVQKEKLAQGQTTQTPQTKPAVPSTQAPSTQATTQQVIAPQPTINPEPKAPTNQQIITHAKPMPSASPTGQTIPQAPPQKNTPDSTMTTPANTAILPKDKDGSRTSLEVKHDSKSTDSDTDNEVVISLH